MKNRFGAPITNQVNINRATIQELDEAIAELEARGYELVKRDDKETVDFRKEFSYTGDLGAAWKYDGRSQGFSKCKAVMRRIIPYVREVKNG